MYSGQASVMKSFNMAVQRTCGCAHSFTGSRESIVLP